MSSFNVSLIQAAATDTQAHDERRLRKAVEGFESMFLLQLLKSMRSAYLSSDKKGGLGQDTFFSICDQALADKLGKEGALGIGNQLFEQLSRTHLNKAEKSGLETTDPRHLPLNRTPDSSDTKAYKKIYEAYMKLNREKHSAPNIYYTFEPNSPDFINHYSQVTKPSAKPDESQVLAEIDAAVTRAADKYDLPSDLLRAVIKVESNGNPRAVSPRGAKGLMQLIDSTANNMGVENVFEPEDNIMGGARYLRQLLDHFKGDLRLALAGYNAGPANVKKFGGIPPFPETQNYVTKVINIMSANEIGSKDSKTLADIE